MRALASEYSPKSKKGTPLRYRAEIDGLRAVAVIPVILFHAGFEIFGGGFVGVDIFFVISGYLITSIILSEINLGKFSIVNFYERRARRILPALFVVMFACLPFAYLWLLPADMKSFSQSLVAVPSFVSNVLFWRTSGYFETSAELKPLLHTWSLAVEEQYYVFFPIFLMLAWKLGRRWLLVMMITLAAVSLAAAQWGSISQPEASFYLLPTRGWELLIGAFVAFYFSNADKSNFDKSVNQVGSVLGLLLITYAILAFSKQTPFPSFFTLVPTIGTALIILFATQQTLVGKLLGNKIFVGIGLISYSAYLWHQPLFAFAKHGSIETPSKLLFGTLAIASVVLAYFSWKYVETPFRNKQRFSRRQIFVGGGVASVFFVAVGVAGVILGGFPSRLPKHVIEIGRTSEDVSNVVSSSGKDFVLGEPKNIKGVLIGDSHAESIAQALGEELANKNLGLKVLTKAGCPPVRGLFRFDILSYGAKCDQHYVSVYKQLYDNKLLETVVISARFTLYLETDRFDNGEGGVELGPTKQVIFDGIEYKDSLRSLRERKAYIAKRFVDDIRYMLDAGKKVILVYPIPEVGWDVPTYGVKRALGSTSDFMLSTSYSRFMERNGFTLTVLDSIGAHKNLIRIYPHKTFCDTFVARRCIAIGNSQAFYRDSNHLTNVGAKYFVKNIVDSFI